MKKLLVYALTVALTVSLVVAEGTPAQAQDGEQIVLRMGTQAPKGTPWGKLLMRMRKRIKTLSGGKVRLKLYWLGKLGSENKLVRRCQKGSVDGLAVSVGALGNAIPELNLIEAPYAFKNPQAAYPKLAKATPLIKELMLAKGIRFVMWGENGPRHFMSKEKLFKTPGELAGVKMRSQPSKPHKYMYSSLKAAASTIAIGDLKQSMSNGVVTGFDNSFIYTYATGLHKEIKYVTRTGHIYQPAIVAWCDAGLKAKLAAYPELLKVIMDVPSKWEKEGRKAVRIMNEKLVPGQFKKAPNNITIVDLTGSQRAAFVRATAPARARLKREASAKGKELLSILGY